MVFVQGTCAQCVHSGNGGRASLHVGPAVPCDDININKSPSHFMRSTNSHCLWRLEPILCYILPWRGFTITLRHTTLGRTPLDEWSARRRDLYLTKHNTHNTPLPDNTQHSQQTSTWQHTTLTTHLYLTTHNTHNRPLPDNTQHSQQTSTWQHTTLTTDRYSCSRRDSNPQSQQARGRRPTP